MHLPGPRMPPECRWPWTIFSVHPEMWPRPSSGQPLRPRLHCLVRPDGLAPIPATTLTVLPRCMAHAGTPLGPEPPWTWVSRGRQWPEPAAVPQASPGMVPVRAPGPDLPPGFLSRTHPVLTLGPLPTAPPTSQPYRITWGPATARARAVHGGQGHVALAAPGGAPATCKRAHGAGPGRRRCRRGAGRAPEDRRPAPRSGRGLGARGLCGPPAGRKPRHRTCSRTGHCG